MLEKYQKQQPFATKIFMHEINSNHHSHAYLIETNGYTDGFGFAIAMAKTLFCVKTGDCKKLYNLIDENNFPELKIIDPEGLVIKKEEIDELQIEFARKPLYSDKKVYIINAAERMNQSASNSLLKFLEEPNQDIVAILITNNINEMLETIVSRCQILSLIKENINITDLNLVERICFSINVKKEKLISIFGEDENLTNLLKCIDFVNYYEKNHLDSFFYLNKHWFDFYKDKDQFDVAYSIILLYYIDILKLISDYKVEVFKEYETEIKEIANNNSIQSICNKISWIIELRNRVKQNNNLNLLMDKLLIEFGRCDHFV